MEILETDRLILDAWSVKDAPQLFEYASDPQVGINAGWRPHKNVRESKKVIAKRLIPNGIWKIVLRATGTAIGTISLDDDKRRSGVRSRELGYSLAREHWGKGLMTEAAGAVVDYGFSVLRLDIIALTVIVGNVRSSAVARKLGFQYEGTQRRAHRMFDESVKDLMCYSLLREEWQARK